MPIGLALGDGVLWVVCSLDGTVIRLDPDTGAALGDPIAVGRGPVEVAVAAGQAWVLNQEDRTVSAIDESAGSVLTSAPIGGAPRGVAAGDGLVWVAAAGPGLLATVRLA